MQVLQGRQALKPRLGRPQVYNLSRCKQGYEQENQQHRWRLRQKQYYKR